MADLSNNSFIPKRGPAKRSRSAASRQVYVFTLVSYILMFATLLGSGGVFLYSKLLDKQLDEEVSLLNTEINSFSESNMQKVLEFENKLQQAAGRLDSSVSMVSVFQALEAATIDTVRIKTLGLEREKDESFILTAAIETNSFDSTIFQRGEYQRNQVVNSVTFSDVKNTLSEDGESGGPARPVVTLEAEIAVPLASIPYTARRASPPPIVISEPAPDEVIESDVNEENI